MRKLKMPKQEMNNFEDVFHIFEASQNAKGVSDLFCLIFTDKTTHHINQAFGFSLSQKFG